MPSTREEALARYPTLGLLIGGEMVAAGDRKTLDVTDPATGRVLGALPLATEADIDQALALAEEAFATWRKVSAFERSRLLHKVAAGIRARSRDLCELMVLELGKPWAEAVGEIEQSAGMWEWAAEEARRAYGRTIPPRDGAHVQQLALLEPVGPVAAFATWNGPLVTPSRKLSGSLAAGCSVIMKAADEVPGVALLLGQIACEAGLPKGAVSVFAGEPEMMSAKLIDSPVIRAITFTGSVRVGKLLSQRAASHMKRSIMELGGHSPVLVFDDVDPVAVAKAGIASKFRNSGQICYAPTRFLVQRGIYDRFVEAMTAAAETIVLGDGFDPASTMGPLRSQARVDAVSELVEDARSRGLRITTGGKRLDREGYFYAPTVIADATNEALVSNIEPFGPIALAAPFDTYEEAIEIANRLPVGLGSFVHSRDIGTVLRAVNDIEAGNVICNSWRVTYPETPFGGHKDSGAYLEGGVEGFRAFTKVKYASLS